MTTRTVYGTMRHLNGDAWAYSPVVFTLIQPFETAISMFPTESHTELTSVSGTFSVSLAVPDSGTAQYQVIFPDNSHFEFNLQSGTSVDVVTLIAAATSFESPSALQLLIDAHTHNPTHATSSIYRRYYHVPLGSANPGNSGATFVEGNTNTTGGWNLTSTTHKLRGQVDIHADWDGASDPTFEFHWMTNVNNTGGLVSDTVDWSAVIRYKGVGDTVVKTQTVPVSVVIGKAAQYTQFDTKITIDWDFAGNVLEAGDVISITFNMVTATSEVDDVVVTSMEFFYPTTHPSIEAGDV